ncbi:MAG: prolipoprotein diacylglyceryl transferase [Verrucomicrobiae bacterium]|nr:prolipoprotein diacylglyceryl transferase [Verrucomicrobiae bacterium]
MNHYVHHLSPYLIQWGEHAGLRYYNLAHMVGFAASVGLLVDFHRRGWSKLSPRLLLWFIPLLAPVIIISSRLGNGFFYHWAETVKDPVSIIRLHGGGFHGMASHGVFFGLPVFLYLFSRWARISFWNLADNIVTVVPISAGLIRLGNFMNGEIWGRPFHLPWAIVFPQAGDGLPRHPFQIYGFLGEGIFLFILMLWVRRQRWRDGAATVFFLAAYSVVRFLLEFLREPDAGVGMAFGWLTRGQLLCLGGLALAALFLWLLTRRRHAH